VFTVGHLIESNDEDRLPSIPEDLESIETLRREINDSAASERT